MVRKIQNSEYLQRYDNMTAAERLAYEKRVGEWVTNSSGMLIARIGTLEARLQNVITQSLLWNDNECQAFEEGAVLLSALVNRADTRLPDLLYTISTKRSVVRMAEILEAVAPKAEDTDETQQPEKHAPQEPRKPEGANPPSFLGKGPGKREDGEQGKEEERPEVSRPKHVDQYIHLLPEKTQERASQLKDLYRELDTAREKMHLLMDDPTAKDDDRAGWATKATNTDNRIRRILDELDLEWARLVKEGRVVVDDLGNARVVERIIPAAGLDTEPDPEGRELTKEQKARRRELRKWLVDTRRGNGETRQEHVGKWKEGFREFLSFDGEDAYRDDRVVAAAAHYGIDLGEFKETKENKEDKDK